MVSVVLTGGVASGKSEVLRVWEAAGVPAVSADELSRRAVQPGSEGLEEVRRAFGADVIGSDGGLDRARLRAHVFQDDAARQRLEAILQPRIGQLRERWLHARAAEGRPLVASEIPLLFEVGLERAFDVSVTVDAPDEQRLRRMVEGRGLTEAEARRIMAVQMDPAERRRRAHQVIVNDGSLAELEVRSLALLERLRRDAGITHASAHASRSATPNTDLRIDFHMHTWGSHDCLSHPEAVLAAARSREVGRIALTDHDRLDVALAMAERHPEAVIPAEEVRTAEGIDVIGLYLRVEIPRGTPAREVCDRVHEQGGLVYLPHPYAEGKGGGGRHAESLVPPRGRDRGLQWTPPPREPERARGRARTAPRLSAGSRIGRPHGGRGRSELGGTALASQSTRGPHRGAGAGAGARDHSESLGASGFDLGEDPAPTAGSAGYGQGTTRPHRGTNSSPLTKGIRWPTHRTRAATVLPPTVRGRYARRWMHCEAPGAPCSPPT